MQKGVYCVDLGESFQIKVWLQNSASIQPRTSPLKFYLTAACPGISLGPISSYANRRAEAEVAADREAREGDHEHNQEVVHVGDGSLVRDDENSHARLAFKGVEPIRGQDQSVPEERQVAEGLDVEEEPELINEVCPSLFVLRKRGGLDVCAGVGDERGRTADHVHRCREFLVEVPDDHPKDGNTSADDAREGYLDRHPLVLIPMCVLTQPI